MSMRAVVSFEFRIRCCPVTTSHLQDAFSSTFPTWALLSSKVSVCTFSADIRKRMVPEALAMTSSGDVEAKTVEAVSALLQEADLLSKQNPKAAVAALRRAVELSSQLAGQNASAEGPRTIGTDISAGSTSGRPLHNQEEVLRLYETGIFSLASLYAREHDANSVRSLLRSSLESFKMLPKARTAKLVRLLVDAVASIPSARDVLIELCQECIEWCIQEKRAFLRVRLELKLAQVYVSAHRFTEASALLTKLLHEVKKLDDKLLLVEVHLLDSELNFLLLYIPKSRAALTAARTNANAIHCPPTLQGQLDLQVIRAFHTCTTALLVWNVFHSILTECTLCTGWYPARL